MLFELAHGDQMAVAELRRTLDLDAGYLSRILSRFIADGLVEQEPSATDARRQLVRLTRAGQSSLRRGRQAASGCDRPPGGAARPTTSVCNSSRQWAGSGGCSTTNVIRAASSCATPEPGDLGWVVERHGARYAAEHGWDVDLRGACRPHRRRLRRACGLQTRSRLDRRTRRRTGGLCFLHRFRRPGHRATAAAAGRTAGARHRSRHPAGGRMPSLRAAFRLSPNHVVDHRCSGRKPGGSTSGGLSARPP